MCGLLEQFAAALGNHNQVTAVAAARLLARLAQQVVVMTMATIVEELEVVARERLATFAFVLLGDLALWAVLVGSFFVPHVRLWVKVQMLEMFGWTLKLFPRVAPQSRERVQTMEMFGWSLKLFPVVAPQLWERVQTMQMFGWALKLFPGVAPGWLVVLSLKVAALDSVLGQTSSMLSEDELGSVWRLTNSMISANSP